MNDAIINKISSLTGSSPVDRFGTPEWSVPPEEILSAVSELKADPEIACDMLVDIVGVDYLEYEPRPEKRFAVIYHFKSLQNKFRLSLRVAISLESPVIPTISALFKNANWLEREAFDQFGIEFVHHPDLRRILNHHQFIGHPLRKDYPITQRQWLTESDTLSTPMDHRLKEKGYL